jgi:tetratricopeptide (TPR) repeat protein
MKRFLLILLAAALFAACASSGGANSGDRLSLLEAIEQSAEKIADELPKGSRVAIVAFESENENLSDFIMEEITGALFDRGMEVADRQNLEYVYRELGFQMTGDVSDETAQSVGKFLGAQMVITGQLQSLGGTYRYRASAVHVEKAARASVTRHTVRNDRETQEMVTALANQRVVVKTAKYGVSENTVKKSAGTFLDRGILFASRGDYEMAIADFSEALKLDANLGAAYILRGRALYAGASYVTNVSENFSGVGTYSTSGNATAVQARAFDLAIADFTNALRPYCLT